MKTCVLFNSINYHPENKVQIKLKHQNLTSQILPVCLPVKADVFAVSIVKYRLLLPLSSGLNASFKALSLNRFS
jgi:hypothetical protein